MGEVKQNATVIAHQILKNESCYGIQCSVCRFNLGDEFDCGKYIDESGGVNAARAYLASDLREERDDLRRLVVLLADQCDTITIEGVELARKYDLNLLSMESPAEPAEPGGGAS